MNNARAGPCAVRVGMGTLLLLALFTNACLFLMFVGIDERRDANNLRRSANARFPSNGDGNDNDKRQGDGPDEGVAGSDSNGGAAGSNGIDDDDDRTLQTRIQEALRNRKALVRVEDEEALVERIKKSIRDKQERPWPRPQGWEDFGFYKIRKHFKCKEHAHDLNKPLPSLEDWQLFRDKYREVIDAAAIFEDPVPPTDGYTLGEEEGPAPIYAALSQRGGRGLFASRDIKRGELVLDGKKSDFSFPDDRAWRHFIFSLPRKKACDVIDWTWTQQTEEGGEYAIFSAMNISVLLNGGDEKVYNVNPVSKTTSRMYATKDIKKGDELLTDYYIYDTVWDKVGLGSRSSSEDHDDDDDDDYDASRWTKLPDDWEDYGFFKIRKYFKCKRYAHNQSKPLPSLEDWQFFREKYKEIVDADATFDDPVPPTDGYTLHGDEMKAPFYAAHSGGGRGRGLFASRDIKKGELVHDGKKSDVGFPDGTAWRRFVFSLPRKKACDVIDWTWTQRVEKGGEYKIFSAMNISVLLNDSNNANINPRSDTTSKMFATRDIMKDEELLMDYYKYHTVWNKVGLGSDGEDDDDDGNDDSDEDDDNQKSLAEDGDEAPQEGITISQILEEESGSNHMEQHNLFKVD